MIEHLRILRPALTLGALLLALAPATASGATFFVDAETSGDPACSESAPCTTINEAVAASRANNEVDTIKIATGLYGEQVELLDPKDSGITIEGSGSGEDPGANTVIQYGGPLNVVMALGSITGTESGMTVRNLRVVNTVDAGRGAAIGVNAQNSTLENVYAGVSEPAGDPVIGVSGGGTRLERVTAEAMGPGLVSAKALTASANLTVVDSDIRGATGGSIQVVGDLQLVRSRVTAPSSAQNAMFVEGSLTADSSLVSGGGTAIDYRGNVASPRHDAVLRGVTIDAGQPGVVDPVRVSDGAGYAIAVQGVGVTARLDSSIALERSFSYQGELRCSFSNVPDQEEAANSGTSSGPIACGSSAASGNFSSPPSDLFVNAPGGDYRLKPGSPAYDRGSTRALEPGESPLDLARAARVASARGVCAPRRDQGAYETQTGVCAAGPPEVARQDVPAPRDAIAPAITGASLSRKVFRVGSGSTALLARVRRRARAGTTLRFTLSEAAQVRIAVERRLRGRRVGRSCRPATRRLRKRRACARYKRAGALTRNLAAGRASVPFSGRIGRRALRAGRYRFAITAKDAAGNITPKPVRVNFRVVRR